MKPSQIPVFQRVSRLIMHTGGLTIAGINYKLSLNNSVFRRFCVKVRGNITLVLTEKHRKLTETIQKKIGVFPDRSEKRNLKPYIIYRTCNDSHMGTKICPQGSCCFALMVMFMNKTGLKRW